MENSENGKPVDGKVQARGWVKWAAIGGVAVAVAGGAGIATAMSNDFGGRWMGPQVMHGQAMQAHWGGGRHGGYMGRGIGRILEEIEVTDEQEDRLWEIFNGARDEVRPMMRDFRKVRGDLAELLSAATLDKAAIEALRAERVAAIDTASKTMAEAITQAAEILTPEQRAKLVEHFEERGPGRRW